MQGVKGKIKGVSVGSILPTNDGEVTVIHIKDAWHITVRFNEHPFDTIVQSGQLRLGAIKNRMKPNVCGVGFIGDGPYPAKVNNKILPAYQSWRDMLRRVYEPHEDFHVRNYSDVTICEEWHNYQNFAAWYYENFNPIEVDFKWVIDKDLLIPGNRIYAPNKCSIIPNQINSLLTDGAFSRGDLPIGVQKHGNHYVYLCSDSTQINKGRQKRSGMFLTIQDALSAYWNAKFKTIRATAEAYRMFLPPKIYHRLVRFDWEEAFEYYGFYTVMGLDTTR